MLFNSLSFVYLVLITFFLYYLPFLRKKQIPILIIASLIFYAWHFPALLFLLLFSIFINAVSSYTIGSYINKKRKRTVAVVGVITNLSLLSVFKYAGLLGRTFFGIEHDLVDWLLSIPLPIGISFFTFQGISLVVDTFRKETEAENIKSINKSFLKHLAHTSLYISLFPQLVAGPIVKAYDFFPQIRPKYLKNVDWEFIFKNLVIGYFLKMVIADNLKDFTFELTWPYFERFSTLYLISLLYAYSIQIFADFAGYSLIAIGLSGLFGYRIPTNFNFPYISSSFSEFWKRWHISLSSFLKEYLYFPLGGNRKGKIRTYINLMIVMALGGLWHGAAWSYMVWGIAHGIFLALERFFNDYFWIGIKQKYFLRFYKNLKILMVFITVSFAWLLFKLTEFSHVIAYFKSIVNNVSNFTDYLNVYVIIIYSLPVVIYHFLYLYPIKQTIFSQKFVKPFAFGILLMLIILNSGSPQGFIYFQF